MVSGPPSSGHASLCQSEGGIVPLVCVIAPALIHPAPAVPPYKSQRDFRDRAFLLPASCFLLPASCFLLIEIDPGNYKQMQTPGP